MPREGRLQRTTDSDPQRADHTLALLHLGPKDGVHFSWREPCAHSSKVPTSRCQVRVRQRKVATCLEMRYSRVMQLPVEITDAQLESLRERAKSLGISPEQLASAAVADLVDRPADDFARAASKVLGKNAELYRRLAR